MFEESILSDVEVVCTGGCGRKFRAHRLVLAARSPVFKAMFLTGMREKRVGRVVIEDASPEAVKCMLDFSYKDECDNLDEASIFDVLKIANKYDMPGLRDICLEFMANHARSDNIVGFLLACHSYSLLEFKHLLLSALVDNPSALHECIHRNSLDPHPELLKEIVSLCTHKMSRWSKGPERHLCKNFDGLAYRSSCYVCVREVSGMSKQMLGEMLFPMVQKMRPDHANKITGMIIELDNLELVPLFESESALREKVDEAVAVLWAAEEPSQPGPTPSPVPSTLPSPVPSPLLPVAASASIATGDALTARYDGGAAAHDGRSEDQGRPWPPSGVTQMGMAGIPAQPHSVPSNLGHVLPLGEATGSSSQAVVQEQTSIFLPPEGGNELLGDD